MPMPTVRRHSSAGRPPRLENRSPLRLAAPSPGLPGCARRLPPAHGRSHRRRPRCRSSRGRAGTEPANRGGGGRFGRLPVRHAARVLRGRREGHRPRLRRPRPPRFDAVGPAAATRAGSRRGFGRRLGRGLRGQRGARSAPTSPSWRAVLAHGPTRVGPYQPKRHGFPPLSHAPESLPVFRPARSCLTPCGRAPPAGARAAGGGRRPAGGTRRPRTRSLGRTAGAPGAREARRRETPRSRPPLIPAVAGARSGARQAPTRPPAPPRPASPRDAPMEAISYPRPHALSLCARRLPPACPPSPPPLRTRSSLSECCFRARGRGAPQEGYLYLFI